MQEINKPRPITYTVTCHRPVNYGAVLQAYALNRKLRDMGVESKVLDYDPSYYSHSNVFKYLFRLPENILGRFRFNRFVQENIYLSSFKYKNYEQILNNTPRADAFITGSDQVWNCQNYENGNDDSFFLGFAPDGVSKISYAASLAMQEIPEHQVERYRQHLSSFSKISVREKSGAELLNNIGVDNVETVVDPVYLLDNKQWDDIANSSKLEHKERYVLAYWLERGTGIHEYARELANQLGVKFYSINTAVEGYVYGSDKYFWTTSPENFVNLIKNAEAVITDSFHGVSFSLIYNRPFHLFLRKKKTKGTNSRMEDLLSDINLSGRIVGNERELLSNEVDFSSANAYLNKKRASSELFLKGAIFR